MFLINNVYLNNWFVTEERLSGNCYSNSDIYINSLIEQIEHYLKEENKMKNSFIYSFLFQNTSTIVPNDLFCNNDKVDETSPVLIISILLVILMIQWMRILMMRITT